MKTLPAMFLEVVRTYSDRPALIDGGRTITYRELGERVGQIAAHLSSIGVIRGERVVLLLANGPKFVETYLGIAAVGAVIVPLNVHYQENELLYFIESSGVSVLVTINEHAALCRRVLSAMVSLARMSGAAIVPIVCREMDDGKACLIIEEAIWVDEEEDRERQIEQIIARYAALFERYILREPVLYRKWHMLSQVQDDIVHNEERLRRDSPERETFSSTTL